MRKVLKIARWQANGSPLGLIVLTYIGPIDKVPAGWVLVMRRAK